MKVQTKDNTQKCKTHNGEPQEEKTSNPGPKPITSWEQLVQGDGWKSWKGAASCYQKKTFDQQSENITSMLHISVWNSRS